MCFPATTVSARPGPAAPVEAAAVALPSGPGTVRGIGGPAEVQGFTGQISYEVSIDVPAARRGFAPALALRYHGALGNGPMGMGWSLAAPVIERSTRRGVPSYDDADELELSGLGGGGRLVAVPAGPHAGEYRIEGQGQAVRVRRLGRDFLVEAGDGVRHRFVPAQPAAAVTDPSVEPFSWVLEHSEDSYGQRMHWRWEVSRGERYLREVSWGPELDCGPAYRVALGYEPRPDRVVSHRAGFERVTAERLEAVTVWSFCEERSGLQLGYDDAAPTSRLVSLERTGRGGARGPAGLRFGYGGAAQARGWAVSGAGGWAVGLRGVALADVDGDGLSDLVRFELGARAWRRNLGGHFGPARDLAGGALRPLSEVRLLDVAGDLRPELLYQVGDTWRIYELSEGAFVGGAPWPGSEGLAFFGGGQALVDVNGDGRVDVLSAGATGVVCRLAGAEGLGPPQRQGVLVEGDAHIEPGDGQARFLDLNGDGLVDLGWVDDRGLRAHLGLGDGRFARGERQAWPWAERWVDPDRVLLADLNRDGLVDVIRVEAGHVYWWAGRPGGFEPRVTNRLARPPGQPADARLHIADLDGDGASEVLWSSPEGLWALSLATAASQAMLTDIADGLGAVTTIRYVGSAQQAQAAAADGRPWATQAGMIQPVPHELVTRTGAPGDAAREQRWWVRDAYFDTEERRFGGYLSSQRGVPEAAGAVSAAGERLPASPARIVETSYEAGFGTSRVLRGRPWRELVHDGRSPPRVYAETYTVWDALPIATLQEPGALVEPLLRVARAIETVADVYEGEAEPKSVRTQTAFDDEARPAREEALGLEGTLADDRVTEWRYAEPVDEAAVWTDGVPCRQTLSDGAGRVVADTATLYAAPDGGSLGPCQVLRPQPAEVCSRVEGAEPPGMIAGACAGLGGGPWLLAERSSYDAVGNLIERFEAGTSRRIDYDPHHHLFAVAERYATTDGTELRFEVIDLDPVLGLPTELQDPSGARSGVAHDDFGRPVALFGLLDEGGGLDRDRPLQTFAYYDGPGAAPFPAVLSRRHEYGAGGTPDGYTLQAYNGLGEALYLAVATKLDSTGLPVAWAVSDLRLRDRRGRTATLARPFAWSVGDGTLRRAAEPSATSAWDLEEADSLAASLPAGVPLPPSVPQIHVAYDALDRELFQQLPTTTPAGTPHRRHVTFGLSTAPSAVVSRVAAEAGLAPVAYDLDAHGQVIRTARAVTNHATGQVDQELTTAHYDAAGRILSYTLQPGTAEELRHAFEYDLRGQLVAADDPDIGRREHTWGAHGRLLRSVNAAGDEQHFAYDALGRLTSAVGFSATGAPTVRRGYAYDCWPAEVSDEHGAAADCHLPGRLAAAWSGRDGQAVPDHLVASCYDARGRTARTEERLASATGTVSRTTDEHLSPSGLRLGTTEQVEGAAGVASLHSAARFDAAGRPEALVAAAEPFDGLSEPPADLAALRPIWTRLAVRPDGLPTAARLGNGLLAGAAFDALGRATGRRLSAASEPSDPSGEMPDVWSLPSESLYLDLHIQRAAWGVVERATELPARTGAGGLQLAPHGAHFIHDGAGRMTAARLAGHEFAYAYDALQRMVRRQATRCPDASDDDSAACAGSPAIAGPVELGDYAYLPASRRLDRAGAATLHWDAAGRLVAIDHPSPHHARTLRYDAFDRLIEVRRGSGEVVEHAYGPTGERVRTDGMAEPTELRFAGDGRLVADRYERLVGPAGSELARLAVTLDGDGDGLDATWLHRTSLPGPALVTGADGELLTERLYEPFGVLVVDAVAPAAGDEPLGALSKPIEWRTGWSDHGARWLAAELGIWTAPDPPVKGPDGAFMARPWDLHPFMYVRQSPAAYWDPDGREPFTATALALAAAWAVAEGGVSLAKWAANKLAPGEVDNRSIDQAQKQAKTVVLGAALASASMGVGGVLVDAAGCAAGSAADCASAVVPGALDRAGDAARTLGRGAGVVDGAVDVAGGVSNAVPDRVARVIPGDVNPTTLGRPGSGDVFVTASDDIAEMSPAEIAERLTISESRSFTVIEFPTPSVGLASPVLRSNPGFVGGGRTAGGAREFVIPNGPIPEEAVIRRVGP